MKRERLEMALNTLSSADWKLFEEFASQFLSSEFQNLRTMAAASGDEGRDAELFGPADDNTVVLQYSVTKSWKPKIQATVKRLTETIPTVSLLIYVTNQTIGSGADALKVDLRKSGIYLDVRDKHFFLDRFSGNSFLEEICEVIAKAKVDPLLASSGIIERHATELTSIEARAAFVYLGLQWRDDEKEKGLTKLSFEGLVKSVLRDTSSANRMTRVDIKNKICSILPHHPVEMVNRYIDSALNKLSKSSIRHWQKEDEFCLSHQETIKFKEYLTSLEVADVAFMEEVVQVSQKGVAAKNIKNINIDTFCGRIRRILERFLLTRSESFASALQSGHLRHLTIDDIEDITINDLALHPEVRKHDPLFIDLISTTVREILISQSSIIQQYLRSLADTYTLLAYLKETPDIQSAIEKMFSHGDIWLDTGIILHLLSETLLDSDHTRFLKMILAAIEAGINLKVTKGVIEEVERHMNRTLIYHRTSASMWQGDVPFLIAQYAETGKPLAEYPVWLETFRGSVRPEQDIADYLGMKWKIIVHSLENDLEAAPENLRLAAKEIIFETHKKRRSYSYMIDDISLLRLASHDVENFVGVIQRRIHEQTSTYGYKSWWLTLDKTAFELEKEIYRQYQIKVPSSPVLSADYLINYLVFGPNRKKVSKGTESRLPVLMDAGLVRYLTPELIQEAEKLREEMTQLPDHVVRRRIRDNLDAAKLRLGRIAKGGLQPIKEEDLV